MGQREEMQDFCRVVKFTDWRHLGSVRGNWEEGERSVFVGESSESRSVT